AISNASRPVTTASARTARRPMQLVSTGGSTWRALVQSHGHRGRARAAVENDPSTEPRPKRVRFVDEPERLGESCTDERQQPNRYEHQIHGSVKRVPRETDDSEAARQPVLPPHRGPLKRAALRVRIDYGDVPSPVRPEAGGCSASVILPTPCGWLRSAMIMARPRVVECTVAEPDAKAPPGRSGR